MLQIDTEYLEEKKQKKKKNNIIQGNGSAEDRKSAVDAINRGSNLNNNNSGGFIDNINNQNGDKSKLDINNNIESNNNNNKSFKESFCNNNDDDHKNVNAGSNRKGELERSIHSVNDNNKSKRNLNAENEFIHKTQKEVAEEENLQNENLQKQQSKRVTRKNLVMDYFAIVLANVKAKLKNKNDSRKQIIKASQCTKQDQKKFSNLYEQIDFILFFPSLINFLIGKAHVSSFSSDKDKNLFQDLYNKYDQEVISIIENFKSFSSVEDLTSFRMMNNSYLIDDVNLRSYIKSHYFDDSEKNHSKTLSQKKALELDKGLLSFSNAIINTHLIKNASLYENYKSGFFKNCINFNKNNFSNYFMEKSKIYIHWKNEIPLNFDWENVDHIRRLPEAETHSNSNLRSLLISTLLRCVYPILKSYSNNIRKKFIEILFSEKIYYEFFLYISSGLYLKFNISQKLLNIITLVFGNNFHHIKEHFKAIYLRPETNKGQKSQKDYGNNNQFGSSNKFKEIKKIFKSDAMTENSFKFYCKLLEMISITTIFLKKIYFITFIEKNINHRSNLNFFNVFISCLNQILNSITNCDFPETFKESVEILIMNNLIKNNLVKNILPFISLITHLNEKVSKVLYKKILMKNLYAQNLEMEEGKDIDDNIIYYLLYFKFFIEKSRRIFVSTISYLKLLCKENKNIFLKEILYFDIKEYQKQLKHKTSKFKSSFNIDSDKKKQEVVVEDFKKTNYKKTDKKGSNEKENEMEKKKEKKEQKNKFKENFVKEIFDEHKLSKLAIELQNIYFPEEIRIVSYKCEVEIINEYRKSFNLLVLTNANIYLFELDDVKYALNSGLEPVGGAKYIKLKIEKVLDLKYFDYNSRLIFEYEKPKKYSIEKLLEKIQKHKVYLKDESAHNNINHETASTINNTDKQNIKDANVNNILYEETSNSNLNSSSLNFTVNELRKEAHEFNMTKLNSSFNSENSFSNNNNNKGTPSALFGESETLNEKLKAGSSLPEERQFSLFIAVSFSSLFEAVNMFDLIQDANRKLKTKSNSAKPNCQFLESFVMMHEKATKIEKSVFNSKANLSENNKSKNKQSIVNEEKPEEENEEIPIFLEDSFRKEEFEFLKNEFKIKNSFVINDDEHVNIMLRKLKAFVVNFEKGAFNLFDSMYKSKSVFNKHRQILFLGEETLYLLEEKFDMMKVEYFTDNFTYMQSIEKSPCFVVSFGIDFKDILDVEIKECECYVEYMLQGRKSTIKVDVTNRPENEFIYFYLMKNLVRNVVNKTK